MTDPDERLAPDRSAAATAGYDIHLGDLPDKDIVIGGMVHSRGTRSISFGTMRQDVTVFHTSDGWRSLLRRLSEKLDALDEAEAAEHEAAEQQAIADEQNDAIAHSHDHPRHSDQDGGA